MSDTLIKLEKSTRIPDGELYLREQKIIAFADRTPDRLTLAVGGVGLNLHRKGGISLTGLPRSGGTTICWGYMRRKVEHMDRNVKRIDLRMDQRPLPDAWVYTTGPFMIRVGKDF